MGRAVEDPRWVDEGVDLRVARQRTAVGKATPNDPPFASLGNSSTLLLMRNLDLVVLRPWSRLTVA